MPREQEKPTVSTPTTVADQQQTPMAEKLQPAPTKTPPEADGNRAGQEDADQHTSARNNQPSEEGANTHNNKQITNCVQGEAEQKTWTKETQTTVYQADAQSQTDGPPQPQS